MKTRDEIAFDLETLAAKALELAACLRQDTGGDLDTMSDRIAGIASGVQADLETSRRRDDGVEFDRAECDCGGVWFHRETCAGWQR